MQNVLVLVNLAINHPIQEISARQAGRHHAFAINRAQQERHLAKSGWYCALLVTPWLNDG
jgi:hypothetical protein